MLGVGSNPCALNNHKFEEETLARMGKDETQVDVEEGEISDSASIEEISEEAFNQQDDRVLRTKGDFNANENSNSNARVWTMRDLYKYRVCGGYASGLYNLAWAQAVQNKSLDDVLVKIDRDENSKRLSSNTASVSSSREDRSNTDVIPSKEVAKIVIDDSGDEKEEGELEEGEIDMDSEPVQNTEEVEEGGSSNGLNITGDAEVNNLKQMEVEAVEQKVSSIREALETVTVIQAEKSFDGVCSRLLNILDSLQDMDFRKNVAVKDTLIQLFFSAIQTVNSVFCSMNQDQKEQKKCILSRLLARVMGQVPPLFIGEQMKLVEAMGASLDTPAVLLSTKSSGEEKEVHIIGSVNQTDSDLSAENVGHDLSFSKNLTLDTTSVESLEKNGPNMASILSEALKPVLPGLKDRGVFGPLLDLHKDHDADSLPSPTRENTPCLPIQDRLTAGDGLTKSEAAISTMACEKQDSVLHPYETDALKAVSTYQQKFGRSSFMIDRLPSPTPSEEGDDGDGDTSGEVSSSSAIGVVRTVNPPILAPPIVSSAPLMDSSSVQGLINSRNVGSVSSGSNPTTTRASAKSRDPRLRHANSNASIMDLNHRPLSVVYNAPKVEPLGEIISSRKHRTAEDSVLDGPAVKKPRNGLTNSGSSSDVLTVAGRGGWLEDSEQFTNKNQLIESTDLDHMKLDNGVTCPGAGIRVQQNVTVAGSEQLPTIGNGTSASLPAILKDIAVNPTLLMNLLKMGEQQRLSAEAQQKSGESAKSTVQHPRINSILGALSPVNISPLMPSGIGQSLPGKLQVPSPMAPMNPPDELGKIRMKPRDPRRILHNNTFQKNGSLGSEQPKANGAPILNIQGSKNHLNSQKPEDLADANSMSSQSAAAPDIVREFTKNLKNIANLMSISQGSAAPSVPQIPLSQPVQGSAERMDVKSAISSSDNLRTGTVLTPDEGAAGPSQSQNTWGDVEHLFEGYDDQQRAAIHRERARRIEEQKKMFAAGKLCLVLDLDHTLLNSAKFGEVDPLHDEILRKKEEQDREKPQRHLFRFSHMGMWTKLRPGIWNFLEKASRLYELHLYTMGNKLYATEMAKVLDPKGVLFAGRVISRGDDGDLIDGDERVPKSKDLDGVLGMESAVVIIDDSVRVWPHNKLNLIVVERYTYFPCSRRQFGLVGPSLLEIDHDERSEDGTLASSLAVIERIHQIFFSNRSLDEVDVRNILALEQRKILAGCRIVFSRVFPVGEANPHLHPLWQSAEQFGAVCTNQIDEQVTHVVANSLGTDKVNWALSTGRPVVHPGWVEASTLLYRRANEQDFAIKP
ncbi:RNA polymerase II C-terminal domain phosphatase-like 3 [Malania oleifera]|uniref:RNA polymerase II C-terminal domain phosphatase-like 3 n=1 Tax=Malania oleifera TaxID=397392 RepID=UPI0025AE4F31|nr:RNA polymerase II C-terminal domain phosphatase-like 3 [Malania oleifera]